MNRPKKLLGIAASILVLTTIVMGASAFAQGGGAMIDPKTPEGTQALSKMKEMLKSDKENSQSYSQNEPELDFYYDHKAHQLKALISKLESGQPIPRALYERAMNNSHGDEFGGY